MMPSRLLYLLIGCVIGFVLGYLVRTLREIKEDVRMVDQHVLHKEADPEPMTRRKRLRAKFGFNDLALLVVMCLVVWASISSQLTTNRVSDQQARNRVVTYCTKQYLTATIAAANARTEFSTEQSVSNVALQQAFNKVVVASLQLPPVSSKEARVIVEGYATALQKFLKISNQNTKAIETHPYPKPGDITKCIDK